MAPPPRVSDNPEVQSHYALQVGVTAALVQALRKVWASLMDPNAPATTLPTYLTAAGAVVEQYSQASASMASDYFDAMRAQAGVTSPFRTPLVDPPPVAQVQASLSWATSDLTSTTAPTMAPDELSTSVQSKVEAVSQKLVTDTGRNEVIAAIEADKEARGFARVTRPGACFWCRMLATRGAVYQTRETAGVVDASSKWPDAKGEINRYHNNCHCVVVPLFGRHYEPPAHTRDDIALWKSSTKGLTGQKAINAFRRAVEAQTTT